MSINCAVSGAGQLPPAYQRAKNIERDLGKAVGLYGFGDQSDLVLRTLAQGKAAYDAVGKVVPVPHGMDEELWRQILNALIRRFDLRAFDGDSWAA